MKTRWGALAVTAMVVACGSFSDGDPSPASPGADGGAEGGPLPDACAGRVLYVSGAAGNDANDGCAPDRPTKTIGAALAFAAARSLVGYELHVCGGVYVEPGVRLAMPVSIRGGYNCVTWTRGPEDVTRVESSGYPATASTLTIAGTSIGRDVVVDSVVVVAPASGAVPSTAILVDEGARPRLSTLEIAGGGTRAGAAEAAAAIGLEVRGGASPEITASKISGGNGDSASGAGSIAVFAHAGGAVDLRDCVVESGNGRGTYGSIGIRLIGSPTSHIEKTRITFRGTAIGASPHSAYGIYASGGELEVSESVLHGVIGGCPSSPVCATGGIAADAGAKITVHRSSIYGGDLEPSNASVQTVGVYFGQDVEGTLTSSVVHAGGVSSDGDTAAIGVDVATSKSVQVSGNTVLASGPSASRRVGLRISAPTGMGSGTGNNSVLGNLFVGRAGAVDIALGLATCGGAMLNDVRKNAFVSFPTTLLDLVGGNCVTGATAAVAKTAISDLQSYLVSLGGMAAGNVMLRPSCATECLSGFDCADANACAQKVFAAWDHASGGLSTLEGAQGLRLSPSGPCPINQGDPTLTGPALTDFFGTTRGAPFSIGHHEIDACQ